MAAPTAAVRRVRIEIDSAKARSDMNKLNRNMKKTATAAQGLRNSFVKLNSTLAILGGAHVIGGIIKSSIQLTDSYRELGGRINLVAKETVGLEQAQSDLFRVAQSTYTSYDAIGTLYARLGMSTKELGASHSQLAGVTQVVANTLRLSGASAQEARSSMLQLSQSMASGVLAGDEFRSISENNVALMDLLAESLGKTRGELKKMSAEGLLTTEKVFKALLESVDKYNEKVQGLPLTVGRAMTKLENSWQLLLVQSTHAEDGMGGVAEAIDEMADMLQDPQFQQGLSMLITGLANFAQYAAQAAVWIAKMANRAGSLAGYMGQSMEINQMSHDLERLRKKAEAAQYAVDLGVWPTGKGAEAIKNAKDLTAEYEKQKTIMENMIKTREAVWADTIEPPESPKPLSFDLTGDLSGGGSGTGSGNKGKGKLTDLQKYAQSLKDAQKEADLLIPKLTVLDELYFKGDISDSVWEQAKDTLLGVKVAAEAVAPPLDAMDVALNDIITSFEEMEQQQLQKKANEISGLNQNLDKTKDSLFDLKQGMTDIAIEGIGGMSDAIIDFALTGKKSFADMAKSILEDLAKMILKAQIFKALAGTPVGQYLGLNKTAKGDAFTFGNVQPVHAFASGGIVNTPTLFPMAHGGVGLMGEAGSEAVMPLRRTRNGDLGVAASGGGGVNVVINNNAPQVDVTAKEQSNGNGGKDIVLFIESTIAGYFDTGKGDNLMGSVYGGRRVPR